MGLRWGCSGSQMYHGITLLGVCVLTAPSNNTHLGPAAPERGEQRVGLVQGHAPDPCHVRQRGGGRAAHACVCMRALAIQHVLCGQGHRVGASHLAWQALPNYRVRMSHRVDRFPLMKPWDGLATAPTCCAVDVDGAGGGVVLACQAGHRAGQLAPQVKGVKVADGEPGCVIERGGAWGSGAS